MKLRWEDTVEARARAVVGCFLEDTEVVLDEADRNQLLYQIEVAIHAQRTEYHVEDDGTPDFRKLVQKIIKNSEEILKGLE